MSQKLSVLFIFERKPNKALSCNTDCELIHPLIYCLFYFVSISSMIFLCLWKLAITDCHFLWETITVLRCISGKNFSCCYLLKQSKAWHCPVRLINMIVNRVTRLSKISPFGRFFMALGKFFSRKNSPMIWAKF
jgi:hypothetical protein